MGPAETQFHIFPTGFVLQSENKFFHSSVKEVLLNTLWVLKLNPKTQLWWCSVPVPLPHLPSGHAVISDKFFMSWPLWTTPGLSSSRAYQNPCLLPGTSAVYWGQPWRLIFLAWMRISGMIFLLLNFIVSLLWPYKQPSWDLLNSPRLQGSETINLPLTGASQDKKTQVCYTWMTSTEQ